MPFLGEQLLRRPSPSRLQFQPLSSPLCERSPVQTLPGSATLLALPPLPIPGSVPVPFWRAAPLAGLPRLLQPLVALVLPSRATAVLSTPLPQRDALFLRLFQLSLPSPSVPWFGISFPNSQFIIGLGITNQDAATRLSAASYPSVPRPAAAHPSPRILLVQRASVPSFALLPLPGTANARGQGGGLPGGEGVLRLELGGVEGCCAG
jgi:hypothetical protein